MMIIITNIYIYLWGENIKESMDERGVGLVGWVGGKWGVTVSILSILLFGCETPGCASEGWKLKNT